MLIQRVSRTNAEKVFILVHNADGDSITTGFGARYLGGIPGEQVSTDGIQAIKIAADGTFCNFAGIARSDIVADGYGLVQVWGYCDSVAYSGVGTQLTIGTLGGHATTFLKVGAAAGTFFSAQAPQGLSTFMYKWVQIFNTTMISAHPSWGLGFVRAL